jgi:hypothetical protein
VSEAAETSTEAGPGRPEDTETDHDRGPETEETAELNAAAMIGDESG